MQWENREQGMCLSLSIPVFLRDLRYRAKGLINKSCGETPMKKSFLSAKVLLR